MHGIVHDFVVANTVQNGMEYPTGFGGDTHFVRDFIKNWKELDHQPVFKKILEIGSLDINGSMKTYDFCSKGSKWIELVGCEEYIGIDLVAGKEVDHIMNAHNLDYKDNVFDLVLCLSVLEHDTDPKATVREAHRVLKTGQPFIMTTVSKNHPEHKHLGGGDTETYNFFEEVDVVNYFRAAGFSAIDYLAPKDDLLFHAIK